MGFFEEEDAWRKDRLGKFTASRIHSLMQKGRGEEYFGKDAKKSIRAVRGELITRKPASDLIGIKAVEWGHQYESEAIMAFEEWLGIQVKHFGGNRPKFFPDPENPMFAGGSPDGMDAEEKEFIIEVKCPQWDKHDLYHDLTSAEDLYEEEPFYYGQMQFNMYCTGTKRGYFVSYHPEPTIADIRLKVIEIPFDEKYISTLLERLRRAIEEINSGVWEEKFEKILAS